VVLHVVSHPYSNKPKRKKKRDGELTTHLVPLRPPQLPFTNLRNYRPWTERHLKHHLNVKRKEMRKVGGDVGALEWKRVYDPQVVESLFKLGLARS
jgi:hypothetical protein